MNPRSWHLPAVFDFAPCPQTPINPHSHNNCLIEIEQFGDSSALPQSSSLILLSPPSEMETKFYYAGLPSSPVLVARTGATSWKAPTGPEAYRKIKELCAVGNHALKETWEGNLALKVHALLDSMKVMWTSTDVVRIGNTGESSAPVILWIGVMPASLSGDDGVVVASKCRELLVEYDIADVNVEIRESVVSANLLPLRSVSPSAPSLRLTGGFFIAEGGNTERLLLATARHVVFMPDKNENKHFERKNDSQRRYNVTLFGDAAFNKYLKYIKTDIRGKALITQYQEGRVRAIEGTDNPAVNKECQKAQAELDEAREAKEKLNTLYQDVSTHWATPESRILGHVILSPPINVGVGSSSEGYTEDWAVIEIDASKVNASNFKGNAIDLGTRIPADEFTHMMYPNPRNVHSFTYPGDRLLMLKGTIPDEEMCHPTAFDQNNDPCLMVIKRGNTTGLTVGRANDICSYARNYYDDDKAKTSKEWAILPFNSKSGPFSDTGDSGSVIVDGLRCIGGLLTGGAGATPSSDITYATPISFLIMRMRANGIRPNLNPILTV
ncbi:hypothetical protein B0H10DRAFT_2235420 [Mycena sp. CBHHK59/15]|nr:hypothetical protein B0H10DRAFT_2235420 [Mycena sp. CBHHK59/15]